MSLFRSRDNYQRQIVEHERLMREHERILSAQMARALIGLDPATPNTSSQTVIHERNDEGKPSATHANGKPDSVLPKELLVHLQEVKGEEREKEVLKTVKASVKKPNPSVGTSELVFGSAQLRAQAQLMNPFSSPMSGYGNATPFAPYPL